MKENYTNGELDELSANLMKRLSQANRANQYLIAVIEALREKFCLTAVEVNDIAKKFIDEAKLKSGEADTGQPL